MTSNHNTVYVTKEMSQKIWAYDFSNHNAEEWGSIEGKVFYTVHGNIKNFTSNDDFFIVAYKNVDEHDRAYNTVVVILNTNTGEFIDSISLADVYLVDKIQISNSGLLFIECSSCT